MGKKLKHGALRKDKYYARAKCAGYRARSAYKLIQLNDKFGFLQKSRVCIDLCAAPGSWMQVAQKFMPVSSCIIGIDRFRISPLYGCISLEGDITTEKCRNDLKNNLKTWKADVVLHDGAPNMGKNWLYDAYQQNLLVLHAFKLACEFLKQGGYFVTKVFRSKDYFKLEYILKKLFKKVDATKPGASRYESAEIFVVCQGFLNPDKVDPHFFSPKYVFHDLDVEPNNKIDLIDRKKRRKAEGYEEGETIFFKKVKVSEFIETENCLEVLRKAWELEFDDERIKKHPLTTGDIIANCKDIKVLNKKDIKKLLIWRKKIKDEFEQAEKEKKKLEPLIEEAEEVEGEEDAEDKLAELDKVEEQIKKLESEASHAEKKALKKKQKLVQKQKERIRLKTLIPGDVGPVDQSEMGVFNLKRLRTMKDVNNVVDVPANFDPSTIDDDYDDDYFDENEPQAKRAKAMPEEEYEENETAELDNDDENEEDNHLVTDLMDDTNTEKKIKKAELWFNRDIFHDVEDDADEDYGIDVAIEEYKSLGGELYNPETDIVKMKKKRDQKLEKLKNKEKEEKLKKKEAREAAEAEAKGSGGSIAGTDHKSASSSSKNSRIDTEKDQGIDMASGESDSEKETDDAKLKGSDSDFEEDSDDEDAEIGPKLEAGEDGDDEENKLDPVGLALATKMIHSAKAKRDVLDAAWNRYMTGEESLPQWFEEDENKHNKLPVVVEPSDLNLYRDREKNVNARTLKKVVEAKARKQRRMKKGMEKARKKAESITTNSDMTQREKVQEVKKLYRKALQPLQKKERTYVVMKKMHHGKAPKGVKGPVRLVDKRMKKDARGKSRADARNAKKGGKRGKSFAGKGKGKKGRR